MKKLILSAAILLGSLSTFTANASVQNSVEKTIVIGDEYIEVKITELPAAIAEAIKKSHADAVITKAYVNESKKYKLELTTGDKSEIIFTDANGVIATK
jgi:spermidine/putrescine-binding protein